LRSSRHVSWRRQRKRRPSYHDMAPSILWEHVVELQTWFLEELEENKFLFSGTGSLGPLKTMDLW
jgi:hypothetical protein